MKGVARASAPASIGNVGVGFDVLGQAFDAVRDEVTAHKTPQTGVRLGTVTGLVQQLPDGVKRNTALRAADAVLQAAGAPFGVTLDVQKGVPLSAGMGGSAASAVAAAAAVNALIDTPFAIADLLPFALEGERASADPPPWDNVMAALLGGLVIAAQLEPAIVKPMPVPQGVSAVLFHPDAKTETQAAREVLKPQIPLETAVEHARRISAFTLGCATSDPELIQAGLDDILIEPQRAFLLPEMLDVKAAALKAGALGCSFSGSGPSVFAWARQTDLDQVRSAMAAIFAAKDRAVRVYQAPLASAGVQVNILEEAETCP